MNKLLLFWRRFITGALRRTTSRRPDVVLPDGFEVQRAGKTGVYVVDNFCTPEEAQGIIDLAKSRLVRSVILDIDGKFTDRMSVARVQQKCSVASIRMILLFPYCGELVP